MRFPIACAIALALCTAGAPAEAHHSFAMFDQSKTMTLNGHVRVFQWTNPHCYIQLMVPDANGVEKEWSLEMGAPMYLYANGWRPSILKPGTAITVTINPLRDGRPGGLLLSAQTADGTPIGKPSMKPQQPGRP
jgi:hypothetical protein